MGKQKTISICFAVYQNKDSLKILYDKFVKIFDSTLNNYNYELVFVDVKVVLHLN